MNVIRRCVFAWLCWVLTPVVWADTCENPIQNELCIEQGNWELGLAIGAGVRTNPLSGGDNLPLVLLPDIAWYGESIYFDNGELGYQWLQTNTLDIVSFVSINRERAFFSFWHPENLLFSAEALRNNVSNPTSPSDDDNLSGETNNPPDTIRLDDIASRKWALDGGVKIQKHADTSVITFSASTDVSGVHNGHQLSLSYLYRFSIDNWRFSLEPTLTYKSAKLIDYYYGIRTADTKDSRLHYSANSSFQPSLAIRVAKPINESWTWLGQVKVQSLDSAITNSPIVTENAIYSAFFGVGYRF